MPDYTSSIFLLSLYKNSINLISLSKVSYVKNSIFTLCRHDRLRFLGCFFFYEIPTTFSDCALLGHVVCSHTHIQYIHTHSHTHLYMHAAARPLMALFPNQFQSSVPLPDKYGLHLSLSLSLKPHTFCSVYRMQMLHTFYSQWDQQFCCEPVPMFVHVRERGDAVKMFKT